VCLRGRRPTFMVGSYDQLLRCPESVVRVPCQAIILAPSRVRGPRWYTNGIVGWFEHKTQFCHGVSGGESASQSELRAAGGLQCSPAAHQTPRISRAGSNPAAGVLTLVLIGSLFSTGQRSAPTGLDHHCGENFLERSVEPDAASV